MNDNFSSKDEQQMGNLAQTNSEVLCTLKSHFPFDLFPTTIVITRTKIDIVDQLFFFSKDIKSILIQDIGRVEVSTNLFLSTLVIHGKVADVRLAKITNLPISAAIQAQSIIQGLLIAKSENVDVTQVSTSQLRSDAETVGQPME